jgi:ubiquinone biosynthesis protein Coq4
MKKLSDWVQTIWLLLHDYGRTDQVFRLYDLTPRFIQRGLVRKLSRYPEGKKLLRGDFNTVAGLMQDREYLQSFPEGSLGHALGQLQLPNLYTVNHRDSYTVNHRDSYTVNHRDTYTVSHRDADSHRNPDTIWIIA